MSALRPSACLDIRNTEPESAGTLAARKLMDELGIAEDPHREIQWESAAGVSCYGCQHQFAAGEEVYRARTYLGRGFLGFGSRIWMLSYCESCAPGDVDYRSDQCGACSREVNYPWDLVSRLYILCSDQCKREHHNKLQREKRLEGRKKECGQCSESFLAPRSDTKFCSVACKQRAYRARQVVVS